MCIEKFIKLKYAKRTRHFYKVLLLHDCKLYSPYRNTEVRLDYTYFTSLKDINIETEIFSYYSKRGYAKLFVTFGEGLFFVCKTKRAAKRLITRDLDPTNQYIIAKAIVPKGALMVSDGFQIATNFVRYT